MSILHKHKYQVGFIPAKPANSLSSDMLGWFLEYCKSKVKTYMPSYSKNELEVYRRITNSEHLQNVYIDRTCPSLIRPNIYEIVTPNGSLKYSYLNIKNVIINFIKANPWIVQHLSYEKTKNVDPCFRSEVYQKTKVYYSIMDGTEAERLRGKIKVDINADDAQFCTFGGSQKFINVYSSFADLSFEHRSQSKNIEIILMANRKLLRQLHIPIRHLFKHLIEDLKELYQNKLIVNIDGEDVEFEVAFSTFQGDALGTYEVAGAKCNFQPDQFVCRDCGAGPEEIQDLSKKRPLIIDCTKDELEDIGMIRDFVFEGLPGVSRFNFAPEDVMHCLCEGVHPKVMHLFLKSIAKDFRLTQEQIKQRFSRFYFYEGNPIVSGYDIGGTAVQV